jgi:hypothetical protein
MLSTQLRDTANLIDLNDEMVIVRVVKMYFMDCFAAEVSTQYLNEAKGSIPPIARFGEKVGVILEGVFYPLVNDFQNFLTIEQKTPKAGEPYLVLKYAPNLEEVPEAEPEYTVPALLNDKVTKQAANKVYNQAKGGDSGSLAALFEYGRATKLHADGDHPIVEIKTTKMGFVLLTSSFSQYVTAKQSETLSPKVGDILVLKDGEVTLRGEKFGGGVNILSIPPEIGKTIKCKSIVGITTENFAVEAEDGTMYWAPPKVLQLSRAIAPTILKDFTLTVVDIVTKDDKKYAKTELKMG